MKYREIDVKKGNKRVGSHFEFKFIKRDSSPKINDKHTQALDEEVVDFYIMYIPIEFLSFYRFYVEFSASKYRKFDNNDSFSPKPIIFVTALNIFHNYNDFGITENSEVEKKKQVFEKREDDFKERTKYFSLDKRKYFLDSSIWHYYLPIENWNGDKKDFKTNFNHILNAIKSNYNLRLYETIVAKEYLEFQTRLMKHSYLENIGGGHHKHIAPFVFHCETEMRIKADAKIDKLKSKYTNITWNVLIVDDYAKKNLKPFDDDDSIIVSKEKIIQNILKKDIAVSSTNSKKTFNFEYELTGDSDVLEETNIFIQNKKKQYDIILLDYLLGETMDGGRELGSDLFINPNYRDLSKNKGPLGKFWIFPITAFSKAMTDKIRSSGVSHVHDDWYLFDGADPIATPQLFRYNLFKLMELQLEQAIVTKEEIIKYVLSNSQKDNNNQLETRQKARRLYGIFMHKFGLREVLNSDENKGSEFAKTVNEYTSEVLPDDLAFYEYTRKLLYLIGYGTHYKAPRMWDIFNYVSEGIETRKNKNEITEKDLKPFLKEISKYINDLSK